MDNLKTLRDTVSTLNESVESLERTLKATLKSRDDLKTRAFDACFNTQGFAIRPLQDGDTYFACIINKEPPQEKVWGKEPNLDKIRFRYGRVFKTYEDADRVNKQILNSQVQRITSAFDDIPDDVKDYI